MTAVRRSRHRGGKAASNKVDTTSRFQTVRQDAGRRSPGPRTDTRPRSSIESSIAPEPPFGTEAFDVDRGALVPAGRAVRVRCARKVAPIPGAEGRPITGRRRGAVGINAAFEGRHTTTIARRGCSEIGIAFWPRGTHGPIELSRLNYAVAVPVPVVAATANRYVARRPVIESRAGRWRRRFAAQACGTWEGAGCICADQCTVPRIRTRQGTRLVHANCPTVPGRRRWAILICLAASRAEALGGVGERGVAAHGIGGAGGRLVGSAGSIELETRNGRSLVRTGVRGSKDIERPGSTADENECCQGRRSIAGGLHADSVARRTAPRRRA